MKTHRLSNLLIVGLLTLPGLTQAEDESSSHYTEMSGHYEEIRMALLADSMVDVAAHAEAIEERATDLSDSLSTALAGVSADDLEQCLTALQEIEASAMNLAETSDLESAREEFFVLTKPMAKYRKLTGDQSTVVAYCPMVQEAWIQPAGEIGNPYLGQEMPTCGEVVGE